MASADEDVDGTVLSFGNLIDERDGAGLVNALDAMFLLDAASRRDGGASPVAYGHDYNVITAASTPVNQAYAETWRTQVGPGQTLRAVFVSLAKPVCLPPVTDQSCTSSSHAGFSLRAFSSGGLPLTSSYSASNNYSYLTYENTGASSATIDLKVVPIAWSGLTSTKTSIAWVAE